MEKISLKNIRKDAGRIMKVAAALTAAAAFLVSASITPAPETSKGITPEILNPSPVVMTMEEAPEAITNEEETAEEEVKKRGILFKLKMAVYGFFAACAAWIAHKIPWRKIFNKRNFYILLVITALSTVVYFAWPLIEEYLILNKN